jgi:hypothetical protein
MFSTRSTKSSSPVYEGIITAADRSTSQTTAPCHSVRACWCSQRCDTRVAVGCLANAFH